MTRDNAPNWVQPGDLDWMANETESLMPDECNIYRRVILGKDSRGRDVESYPIRKSLCPCSFNPKGGREIQSTTTQTVIPDAQVRLPLDSGIENTDKVEIVVRYGREVEPMLYRVIGFPDLRATAINAQLQKVGG